jgi:hypothetical protein
MRTIWTAVVALSFASPVSDARAGAPTTMFIHNLGPGTTRVQVALGSVVPCDSTDNRLMFDGVVLAGEWRALSLAEAAVVACVRNTSAGTHLDWGLSRWISGGFRCRGLGRGRQCWPDPTVPMIYEVRP